MYSFVHLGSALSILRGYCFKYLLFEGYIIYPICVIFSIDLGYFHTFKKLARSLKNIDSFTILFRTTQKKHHLSSKLTSFFISSNIKNTHHFQRATSCHDSSDPRSDPIMILRSGSQKLPSCGTFPKNP